MRIGQSISRQGISPQFETSFCQNILQNGERYFEIGGSSGPQQYQYYQDIYCIIGNGTQKADRTDESDIVRFVAELLSAT